MSSHGLLLRLFLSPSFFSVHVALKYLLVYADNVGITYYLTFRLRELQVQELTDVWGFICHLLITRPTKSRAIECFVVDTAQRSTHIALITLWFMQASLADLALHHRHSPSFAVCQRVLHKCHEIIFSDLTASSSGPYSTSSLSSFLRRRKIKHHVEPAFVGIGMMLAGVPAMPRLTEMMGDVALEQGRAEEDFDESIGPPSEDDIAPPAVSSRQSLDDEYNDDSGSASPEPSNFNRTTMPSSNSALLARRRTVAGAQTVPTLPLHLRTLRKPRLSDDPLGQLEPDPQALPSQSSPALTSALMSGRTPLRSAMNPADMLLERYDSDAQTQLLRNHYCSSEVQFLLSLENICNRLLVVPRPARVSALRAELTALNHKLPAEVCLPLWCPGTDSAHTNSGHPHHRIVRIPPGESVVLNSAERAPYLLLVEILQDDLDFEPAKKSNKEVLRKIMLKSHSRKALSLDSPGLTPSTSRMGGRPSGDFDFSSRHEFTHEPHTAVAVIPPTPSTATAAPEPDSDEEVDLVEQLYGSDQPLKSTLEELADNMRLPPTPKNKDLDLATWSRSSPHNGFSSSFNTSHTRQSSYSRTSVHLERSPSRSPNPSTPSHEEFTSTGERVLSLDEYSERMRTAAIMLAQLNSSLVSAAPVAPSPRMDSPDPSNPSGMRRTVSNGIDQSIQSVARQKLHLAETAAIRDRIMKEMMALEEERMARMQSSMNLSMNLNEKSGSSKTLEDESIIRKELNKVDPSAVVFSESWAAKKARIRQSSPYGHLAQWDCMSVIVKTGGDLRQEQLAVQLIHEFQRIWAEEKCACWVKHFRILITGSTSGLIETIKDSVSIHSIKKAEYAKRLAEGNLGHVTLLDHFKATHGEPGTSRFIRAQQCFARSLAGYSLVTYLLQVKDRHNGNILLDREGHLVHIDFGFILSNTPGNIGFEAAPFKFPLEYVEILGGVEGSAFKEFKRLFREGFEAARKHCDRIITLVELMQKDSSYPCFAASAEQTANQLRDRFQPTLTHSLVGDHVERLIATSLGSHWTRLYDSFQYYSQSIL